MKKEKIAIIGTGVTGLSCGHFLHKDYDLTFYEKDNRIGGHAHTVYVREGNKKIPIDTAFEIFSKKHYPHFSRMLSDLHVESISAPMTLSVRSMSSGLEYSAPGIWRVFSNPKNMLSWRYYKLLAEIARFTFSMKKILRNEEYGKTPIRSFLKKEGYSRDFEENYFIPLIAIVWSLPMENMENYPIINMVNYMNNHGMLGFFSSVHAWKTIKGGSIEYVKKISAPFKNRIMLNTSVKKVTRMKDKVVVETTKKEIFDRVIFTCHADDVLKILSNPTKEEKATLSKFKYDPSKVILHTDSSIMPKRRSDWASWNCVVKKKKGKMVSSFTYYMNDIQRVSKKNDYFVTVYDLGIIDPKKIIQTFHYRHPLFDVSAIETQKGLHDLNQNGKVYFGGAYFGFGFHEDGFRTGYEVAKLVKEQ